MNPASDEKCGGAIWGTFIGDALAMPVHWYAWKYADDFEAGLVANTNLGGDNCHRGAVVGALLGAAAGTGRIPARFCDGLHNAAALRRQMQAGKECHVRRPPLLPHLDARDPGA